MDKTKIEWLPRWNQQRTEEPSIRYNFHARQMSLNLLGIKLLLDGKDRADVMIGYAGGNTICVKPCSPEEDGAVPIEKNKKGHHKGVTIVWLGKKLTPPDGVRSVKGRLIKDGDMFTAEMK